MERVREVFERAGYGEIYTPALEYERTFAREGTRVSSPYRLFDEHGNVLVLRSDMTVPIARMVGSRYPSAPTPLRFCYFAHAYHGVRPQRGQSREVLQAGVELIGAPGPEGTAEALTVLCDALEAAGLENFRVGCRRRGALPVAARVARRGRRITRADPRGARDRRLRRGGARAHSPPAQRRRRGAAAARAPHARRSTMCSTAWTGHCSRPGRVCTRCSTCSSRAPHSA